jgi:hypothetical protein
MILFLASWKSPFLEEDFPKARRYACGAFYPHSR